MGTSRKAVVGAFVAAGLLLFSVGLFLIGDRRLLFVDRYELFTEFGRVTGVEVGTSVRVAGLPAGEVTDVIIPPGPEARFRVEMRLRADLQPLVRADSVASIQTDGIVGNAFIQIGGGTEASPVAPARSTIAGRDPIEFADLIEEGRDTFRVIAREILELRGEVSEALNALTATVEEANTLIVEVRADALEVTENAKRITGDLGETTADVRTLVADVRAGKGNLGKLLTEDDLWVAARQMSDDGRQAIENVRQASAQLREAVARFQAQGGPSDQLMASLRDAVENAREVMSDMAETTEAMKHHWLVRGFYRDRGYFDLDSMTLDEYRRGAVEGKARAALRVWIEADNLFEQTDGGSVRLTDAGRRRLDVAMADFLRYPRDSPLVVEGYATTGAPAERYLLSDARAQTVEQYLQRRYSRDSALVGRIVGGLEAPGAPTGNNRWDGVALALFVRKDLLAERQRNADVP